MKYHGNQDLLLRCLKVAQYDVNLSKLSWLCTLRQRPEIFHLCAGEGILRCRVGLADSGTKPPLERASLRLTFPKQST